LKWLKPSPTGDVLTMARHVFAGGKRIATFEPQGGVFGYRLKPKHWDDLAKTAELAFLWPLQENRAPGTVMLLTLLGILLASVMARRGFGVRPSPGAATSIGRGRHWNPNATIARAVRKFLLLLREKAGMRAGQQRRAGVPPAPDRRDACPTLTPRERRWFLQPLWHQALSVLLIVAMVLATTNTDVHAAIPNPIFYYHVGDHLGSSNLVTDRNGALVQHREYWAFGQQRVRSESAQDYVFNRYTGQVFDDETGLYYYGARYYDPELGRFIQPDTIVPYPDDPQTLNRYSYVNNNPLKYTDPTGHIFGGIITGLIIAIVVGAGLGAATAAATGGDPARGAVGGALAGGLGFLGGVVGGAAGGALGSMAGSVATAAIYGDDIGQAALTASIGTLIGFGVGLYVGPFVPDEWYGDLISGALATGSGALAGGISAEATGGDFSEGATTGAISGAIGWAITEDLPDAYRNRTSDNPRFHLFMDGLLMAIPDGWLENSANLFAGWSDALTFGLTNRAREGYGINDVVNKDSASYKGGIVLGAVHSTALQPGRASSNLGVVAGVGRSKPVQTVAGNFTKKTFTVFSKPGQSRAEYTYWKNAQGKVIRSYKDSYDRANRFMHRKPLRGGSEGRPPS
jgi:RHS repeat-associated protein